MVQFKVPMKLEDELVTKMSKRLAEEIDWKILADILVSTGWVMVNLNHFQGRHQAIDIETWIDNNCKGKYKKRSTTFVFEKKDDAAWFKLRWL
jgi:hypothetical protein